MRCLQNRHQRQVLNQDANHYMHLCGVVTTQHVCKVLVSLTVLHRLKLQYACHSENVSSKPLLLTDI